MIYLIADDANQFCSGEIFKQLFSHVEKELKPIKSWLDFNKSLNKVILKKCLKSNLL